MSIGVCCETEGFLAETEGRNELHPCQIKVPFSSELLCVFVFSPLPPSLPSCLSEKNSFVNNLIFSLLFPFSLSSPHCLFSLLPSSPPSLPSLPLSSPSVPPSPFSPSKVILLESSAEIFQYLQASQLTKELGGTLSYNHDKWIDTQRVREPVSLSALVFHLCM